MGAIPSTPFCQDYGWFQANGDELADTMGSTAGSYFVSGLKVIGAREQGWTACTGGTVNKAGINATSVAGTFLTTSADTLSTACLALATLVYENRKTIAALQAALMTHGAVGTTIV